MFKNISTVCFMGAALLAASVFAKGPETQPAGVLKPIDDKTFVADSASGGMLEVALGKFAVEHGTRDDVKAFGNRMVADHSKANDELSKIAMDKNIAVPKQMSDDDQKMYDMLTKAQGADFDKQYIHHMVMDHQKDIVEFQGEAKIGHDPDIKAFAAKTLPTLEEHLTMAKACDANTAAQK